MSLLAASWEWLDRMFEGKGVVPWACVHIEQEGCYGSTTCL